MIPLQHPLSWWRTRPANKFKHDDVRIARHFLTKAAIIGEPHWFLGVEGDAAITIGVALRAQRRKDSTPVTVDLAMTAVLCCALTGNVTAALLMSSMLKVRTDIDPRCKILSDSWLTYKAVTLAPQPRRRALLRPRSTPPRARSRKAPP